MLGCGNIFQRRRERRTESVLSYLLSGDASLDEIEVYARTDKEKFPYKGLIKTPRGCLRFGAGWPFGVTKREFNRRLKANAFRKISFATLIMRWDRHGLWDCRVVEQRLVDVWLPRVRDTAVYFVGQYAGQTKADPQEVG